MILKLQPYDWTIRKSYEVNEILCWCLSKNNEEIIDNEKVLVRIFGFPSVCYIQLPRLINGSYKNWDETDVSLVQRYFSETYKDNAPLCELITGKTLYYYQKSNTLKFIKLYFKSDMVKGHVTSYIRNSMAIPGIGTFVPVILENDDVTGNVILGMLSLLKLSYSQWFTIELSEYVYPAFDKISDLKHEYAVIDFSKIVPIDPEKTLNIRVNPRILCVDIETYCANHHGKPNPNISANCVYMISCIYQQFGIPSTLKKILLTSSPCDPIPGVDLRIFPSELDLIRGYEQVVKETNPEIITGYNIFGFDFWYMNIRLKRWLDDWSTTMSLIKGVKPIMYEKEWYSSAYQVNSINYPDIDGRIHFDMMTHVKREFKLPRYKLDIVAKKFLKEGKDDMPVEEMFRIYDIQDVREKAREMSIVGKYCIQDSVLVMKLFEKFAIWHNLVEQSNINDIPISYLTTRGQQIRVINKIIREIHYRSATGDVIVIDKAPQAKTYYAGAFVKDPRLGRFNNVLTWDFASLYPSIIQAYNMCFTTVIKPEQNANVPDNVVTKCEWTDKVTDKQLKAAMKKGNVIVDIADEDEDSDEKKEGDQKKEGDEKIHEFHHEFKFVKKDIYRGILPAIVEELVRKRREVRDEQIPQKKERISEIDKLIELNPENDMLKSEREALEVDIVILNARQLALKVTANSVYGFTGAVSKGMLPCIEVGTSITATGRQLIGKVYDYVLTHYPGSVDIYGDTDSCMFDLGIKDSKKCRELGERIADELTALFPKPVKMEFEKAFSVFITFTKKNYAGVLLDKKGNPKLDLIDIFIKGLPPVRRDFSDWVKDIFMRILNVALKGEKLEKVFPIIEDAVYGLYRREVTAADLSVTSSVGKEYKSKTYPMALFKQYYANIGRPLMTDDRVAYVVIDTGIEGDYKGNKMRLVEHFYEAKEFKLDYNFYLEKVLAPQVRKLLKIAFKGEIEKYDQYMHNWPSVRKREDFIKYCSEYVECLQRLVEKKKVFQSTILSIVSVAENDSPPLKVTDLIKKFYPYIDPYSSRIIPRYIKRAPVSFVLSPRVNPIVFRLAEPLPRISFKLADPNVGRK